MTVIRKTTNVPQHSRSGPSRHLRPEARHNARLRADVPHCDGALGPRGGEQVRRVAREGGGEHGAHAQVAGDQQLRLAGADVPQLGRLVRGGGGQQAARRAAQRQRAGGLVCEGQNGYRTRVSTRWRAAIANTGHSPCAASVNSAAAPPPRRASWQVTCPSSVLTRNCSATAGFQAAHSTSAVTAQLSTAPPGVRTSATAATWSKPPVSSTDAMAGFHTAACTLSLWCVSVCLHSPRATSQTCGRGKRQRAPPARSATPRRSP